MYRYIDEKEIITRILIKKKIVLKSEKSENAKKRDVRRNKDKFGVNFEGTVGKRLFEQFKVPRGTDNCAVKTN